MESLSTITYEDPYKPSYLRFHGLLPSLLRGLGNYPIDFLVIRWIVPMLSLQTLLIIIDLTVSSPDMSALHLNQSRSRGI